ncbi:transposase family protein [Pseudoalteromonas luteoviolacea]|uniref:integrase core domain-containing protein n=1 Tax=Pseudoalteromonas luteoviolacea TaxID=43657 RepID=UPI001B367A10|nr:transposase family protein [Pseudoalteromonas luteoviolacea]
MACFAARHKEGCDASTVLVKQDEKDELKPEELSSSDIKVDLDKSGVKSIYISNDNNKHGDEESLRKSSKNQKVIGSTDGYPLNKSLRQLLTNLCRNSEYALKEDSLTVVADSGRVIRVLERVIAWRGKPKKIRVDNGPEFTSSALENWVAEKCIKLEFIKPDSPYQNGFVERFNRSYREEVLDLYLFESLQQVRDITDE